MPFLAKHTTNGKRKTKDQEIMSQEKNIPRRRLKTKLKSSFVMKN